MFWWFDAGATPDLIPNSEVKPCSSDDTLLEGKVASRQNTELKPKNHHPNRVVIFWFPFFCILASSLLSPQPNFWRVRKRGCAFARPERDGARRGQKIF